MPVWNEDNPNPRSKKMADERNDPRNDPKKDPQANVAKRPDAQADVQSQEEKKKEQQRVLQNVQTRTSPLSASSPSHEESEKAVEGLTRKTEEKDGVKTVVSSVSQEEMNKAKDNENKLIPIENLTQSLTGSPGNVDLTQSGRLAGDKSLRSTVELEEINKEMEDKAGPNPSPNREGNEFTKMQNQLSPFMVRGIDKDTSGMANELKKMREEGNFTEEQKNKLKSMEQRLQQTGRI
jgi:hypothetical protein